MENTKWFLVRRLTNQTVLAKEIDPYRAAVEVVKKSGCDKKYPRVNLDTRESLTQRIMSAGSKVDFIE